MKFAYLMGRDPSGSEFQKQTPNFFCRHKWERTTLQTGQKTVLDPEQGTISSGLLTVGVLGT